MTGMSGEERTLTDPIFEGIVTENFTKLMTDPDSRSN